ncbi:MAG: hypothetical protein R3E86_09350 [Pseudomonadales bacterium]
MTRVFIADPALKDHRGHHYNLTRCISKTCEEFGLETVWLVNKAFSRTLEDGERAVIHPCFSADTYDAHLRKRQAKAAGAASDKHVETVSNSPSAIALRLYRRIPQRYREVLTPTAHRLLRKIRELRRPTAAPSHAPSNPGSGNTKRNAVQLRPEQEIYRALKRFNCTTDDIVLFHTSDAHTYRDIYNFFSGLAHVSEWNGFPVFHLSTPYDETVMPHNRDYPDFMLSVRRLNNLGLVGSRVILHSENDLLTEHLEKLLRLKVTTLHIPPASVQRRRSAETLDSCVNVAYLGAARTEKGFNQLPDMISEILRDGAAAEVRFHIQATPQMLGYTDDVRDAIDRLRAIDDERLTLVTAPLSQAEYQSILEWTDVLLVPYQLDRYRVRGSGIAVEGVIAGANLISTEGTFPAYLAGDAGVAVKPGAPLAPALLTIIADRRHYYERACERREWYIRNHSSEQFVQELESPVCRSRTI